MSNAADRGDFVPQWNGGPKVTKKINGRLVTEALRIHQGDERTEAEVDMFLAGVSQRDLEGPRSGFMRHFGGNEHRGTAGSGEPVARPERSDNYDMGGGSGEEDLLYDPQGLVEHPGTADLFGQPSTPRNRQELFDPADDFMSVNDQGDAVTVEDITNDMELFETFEQDYRGRPREPALASRRHSEPVYDNDSLVDLFGD